MISAAELTAKRQYYLERFTRFEFPEMFAKYKEEIKPFIDSISGDSSLITPAVRELLDYADSASKGLFGRGLKLDDFRRFFTLYLVPATIDSGDAGSTFAHQLCDEWNARFPKYPFTAGTYKDIADNFRTRPFGM